MVEDTGTAQARELLRALWEQVDEMSRNLDAADLRIERSAAPRSAYDRRQLSILRQELDEAHFLIAGLHRRYPEAVPNRLRAMTG